MKTWFVVCVVLFFVVAGNVKVQAQDYHDKIIQSLVYLKASGQVRSGPNASQEVDSEGTGFLVSDDGLVLTVYHLISELGDVVPQTVSIEARIGAKTNNPLRAVIVDAAITTDLMLLKLPPKIGASYPHVRLGSARDHDDTKFFYTSGFPENNNYRKQEGKIEARSGPGGYTWAVSIDFNAGQSGSPVYESDTSVIGVVKGDDQGTGYIIPIEFGDALLAQIRLRDIRKAMQDFEVLRRQFNWYGELDRANKTVRIFYEKQIGGEPHVDSIRLLVQPFVDGVSGSSVLPPFTWPEVPYKAVIGDNGRMFELDGLYHAVETFRDPPYTVRSIEQLQVDIVPVLSDGSTQRKKRIPIDWSD